MATNEAFQTNQDEDRRELEKPLLLPNQQEPGEHSLDPTTTSTTSTVFDSYIGHAVYISCYILALSVLVSWKAETTVSVFQGGISSITVTDLPRLVQEFLPSLVVVLLLVYLLWSEVQYLILRRRMPPGDHGYPCLGHAPQMFLQSGTFFDTQRAKYGKIFTMNMLMRPIVVLMEDEDVAWAQSQERKEKCINEWPDHLQALIGSQNFFTMGGKGHRKLRRLFEPAFSPKAVRGYLEVMDQNIQTDFSQWAMNSAKDDVFFLSTHGDVKQNALKTFFLCCFSKNQVTDERIAKLNGLIRLMIEGTATPIPVAYPGSVLSKAHQAKPQVHAILNDLILEFKAKHPEDTPEARQSFMGHFIHERDEQGEGLSVDEIVENLFILVVAGYDTSGNAFGSALHYLYHKPELLQVLSDEVQQFAEPLDYDQLKEAPILNAFLAEIWRIDAARLPHMTRVTQDLHYKGYTIPRGAGAYFVFGQAMLNPKWYIEPNEFIMERFLPKDHPLVVKGGDSVQKFHAEGVNYNHVVSNHKYRGFGGGIHSCVGHNFAKLQARIAVTRLVQNYSIRIGSETKIDFPMDGWNIEEFKLLPKN